MDPYRRLAVSLIYGAALDYHRYWNTELRRQYVVRALRAKRLGREAAEAMKNRILERLHRRALAAENWLRGDAAPMPFSLCAESIGWHADNLCERVLRYSTGHNLGE